MVVVRVTAALAVDCTLLFNCTFFSDFDAVVYWLTGCLHVCFVKVGHNFRFVCTIFL